MTPRRTVRPAGLARRGPARRGHRRRASRSCSWCSPTLESSVRTDRAESERRDLAQQLDDGRGRPGRRLRRRSPAESRPSPTATSEALGGEVKLYYQPGVGLQDPIIVHSPEQAELVTSLPAAQGRSSGGSRTAGPWWRRRRSRRASGEAVVMAVRRLEGRGPRDGGRAAPGDPGDDRRAGPRLPGRGRHRPRARRAHPAARGHRGARSRAATWPRGPRAPGSRRRSS